MEPFSTLEITFIVPNEPTDTFTAYIAGELDESVSEAVGAWDIENQPGASVEFAIGEETTISMEFAEPIKFTGNWTGITTNIWVLGDDSAMTSGAHITSFIVDGEDLGSREVPLINRDGNGFLCIDIARQWGGSYDEYDLAGMEPFSTLEITFIVPEAPEMIENAPEEIPELALDYDATYNAWIGGTFLAPDSNDETGFDWVPYEDQTVPFKINETFTVTLDLGSETQTHGEASFGYITVVQTDIMDKVDPVMSAYIESIKVDGNELRFDASGISVGYDGGVRIGLTDSWAVSAGSPTVLSGPQAIGTFSKLEVTMAFCDLDFIPEFGSAAEESTEPAAPPPPVVIDPVAPVDDTSGDDGMPGWVIPVIIAGAVLIICVVVFLVIKSRKK